MQMLMLLLGRDRQVSLMRMLEQCLANRRWRGRIRIRGCRRSIYSNTSSSISWGMESVLAMYRRSFAETGAGPAGVHATML